MKLRDGFSGQRSIVFPRVIIEMMTSDPVLSSLYITDIGYYPMAEGHFRERKEPIGEHVIIYCTHGEGWFEVEGKRHEVKANSWFILPAGRPHSYAADKDNPWTIYWIHFNGTLAASYASEPGIPHIIKPGMNSRIRNRLDLFEELFSTLNEGFNIEGVRYAMSLFHHYLGTLRYLREYRYAGENKGEDDIINAVIHFMTENIEHPLSLDELSAYSGLSRSYLSSVFKSRTGHAPLSYFNLLKIRHACRLIDETNMQLNTICHKTGIADPYYFSRLFSKIMGMSPSAYRHRQKT